MPYLAAVSSIGRTFTAFAAHSFFFRLNDGTTSNIEVNPNRSPNLRHTLIGALNYQVSAI